MLAHDLKLALRAVRRSPGFATVAILCLSLGIGANTAMFSIVNAVLLRPLPYPDAGRIVAIHERSPSGKAMAASGPDFDDWRDRSRSLAAIAEESGYPTTILGAGSATRATMATVSREFFSVMGTGAALGRTFTADEHREGAAPAVVISDRFWRERYGASRSVLGARIQLEGATATVVGVMPPAFDFPDHADLWLPVELLGDPGTRTAHNFDVVARLKPGVSVERARNEMETIASQLKTQYSSEEDAVGVILQPLQQDLAGPSRQRLLLLMGAVGCVLLIVCLNLSSALLARDQSRARDIAIRTALGADRGMLVRQLLTESLLLAIIGGAAGLWLGVLGTRALLALVPAGVPSSVHVTLDARVAAFTLVVSVVTGLCFGLVPAFRASRVRLRDVLAEGSRGSTRGGGRLRSALVVTEVALSVVLLSGAGLLLRSLGRLLTVNPGFEAGGVLTALVDLPQSKYADPPSVSTYYDRLTESLRGLPGVTSVGAISDIPLGGSGTNGGFALEDASAPDGYGEYRLVEGRYFEAMRIPLRAGRLFGPQDAPGTPDAVVISESLARTYWPGQSALGHRIRFLGMDQYAARWLTVIGVVGDVRARALATPGTPTAYISLAQRPARGGSMSVVVRSSGDPARLIPAVRDRIHGLDADVPMQLSTMTTVVDHASADRRFTAVLLTAFASAAMLLAAIGIYAILAFSVTERRREIGVRLALGARTSGVLGMIIGHALTLTGIGLAIGVALSLFATRLLASQLYDTTPTDIGTFAGVCATLAAVAVLASWLPARRAATLDPIVALRDG